MIPNIIYGTSNKELDEQICYDYSFFYVSINFPQFRCKMEKKNPEIDIKNVSKMAKKTVSAILVTESVFITCYMANYFCMHYSLLR